MDLDGTLTEDQPGVAYPDKQPRQDIIQKLREYKAAGFEIIIATARNMKTHNNNVGRINALTLPIVIDWLNRHDIPFDEIHVGKPWCGTDGFYVDDKAIRPEEFARMDYDAIRKLLETGGADGV
jgi:capsule biosynthesis phosphatase